MKRVTSMPMVTLRGQVVLPEKVEYLDITTERLIEAVREAMESDQKIFLLAQKDETVEEPEEKELYRMGTVASIQQTGWISSHTLRVVVTGEELAELNCIEFSEPYLRANLTAVEETGEEIPGDINREAMLRGLKKMYKEYVEAVRDRSITAKMIKQVENAEDLKTLVARVAAGVKFPLADMQEILEETDYMKRYDLLAFKLVNEVRVVNVRNEIQAKVKARVDERQKQYILREEIKLIREELGEDHTIADAEEFETRLSGLQASDEVKAKIQKEIERFKTNMQSAAESGVIRTYIETMLDMPWDKRTEDVTDIVRARKLLNEQHYGLDEVKERILEFLAVRALTKKGTSPILCLAGPPGTGKTSIARSLAEALQKPYVRISLGGVRDEAEIRGHRKTYVGAMPGRIAGAIQSAGVKNPVLLLDEIDKVSNDYKGDTFSALLEVLDGEQNSRFRDHYLEVPLDLSEVTFVTTANTLQTIPKPLLDRMEVIEVSSYTENEKLHIAREHLIPKQLERHGLGDGQLTISKGAVWKIARNYTREAGVRQLERLIGNICRKAAREIFEEKRKKIQVTERNLTKYLGKEKYTFQQVNERDEVGVVRGLAWTSVGGDTLQIEVNVMPGKGEILLTGQMGDVMKESAQAGISYIRSISREYHVKDDFFETHDIHIHIPEGAVPKDGPSAGITMASAMLSAITGRKVKADLAMTGEITLRGRVLPIGGLKEKLLAAKNAGIRTVLIPFENQKDVEELSTEITKGLEIVCVSQMEEVLEHALTEEAEKKEETDGH